MKSKISVLKSSLSGDLLDGHFDRGRYSTDASIYQIMPEAVVLPKTVEDIQRTIQFSQENSIPILPRGGGTSQNLSLIHISSPRDGLLSRMPSSA